MQITNCRLPSCRLNRGPEWPAAHVSIYLALLPSGPDAVRRLKLHRFRAADRSANLLSLLQGNVGREEQVVRQNLTDDDGEEVHVEDAGGRLRGLNLCRFPCQVREQARPEEAEQHALPEENPAHREDVVPEAWA